MKRLYLFFMLCLYALHGQAQYNLVVAADGTGDYRTVQAAINAATPGTATNPFRIFIKNGKYFEKDTVHAAKVYLQLIGESVGGVTIAFNAAAPDINPANGVAYGTSGSATFTINADNFTAFNITFENTAGRIGDGPQAVALNVGRDKAAFKNCRFIGGQDTVYANGNGRRQYFRGCYIDGNTDFIFGSAIALFDSCVIFGRDRVDGQSGGIITAANTPSGQAFGYVFRDCRIPASRITTSYSMGRPWGNAGTPNPTPAHNKTVFIRTKMGGTIKPAGWDAWDAGTVTSVITYAEHNSRWFSGAPIDVSQRLAWSYQLPQAVADTYTIARMFTNTTDSWNPDAIPGFSTALTEDIAIANLRVKKAVPQMGISWNVCWPMTGIKYELFRSHNNITFTKVREITSAVDTTVAFYTNDPLVAGQSQYYYYVKASKAGYTTYMSDTVYYNTAVPLPGEFRSVTTGNWADGATWEKYDGATSAWVQQSGTGTSAYPGGSSDAQIRTGHHVTLNATGYINAVTIDSGAVLSADASARTIRVSSGIVNAGLFGGPTSATNNITLEFPSSNTTVTLTGNGNYYFNRIRGLTGLVNAHLVIDADITLTGNLAAWYNNASVTTNEVLGITINEGATVTLTAGALHATSQSNTNNGGTYTYNINGTLDMSASTATTCLLPLVPATSALHINVGKHGLLKFGTKLYTTNTASGPVLGSLKLNIADSGRVDGSALLNSSFEMNNSFWDISGSGTFSRKADSGATVAFPVRSAGSAQHNTMMLTNLGADDVFRLGLRDTVANLATNQTRYVKRQWNLEETNPGGNVALSFAWTSTDHATGFDPAQAYAVQYNGTTWDSVQTTITGAGTVANPYLAAITGLATVSSFSVFNAADAVSVPGISKQDLILKPNPAKNNIALTYDLACGAARFEIFNIKGQKVFQQAVTTDHGTLAIDLTSYDPGYYFLRVSCNSAILKTFRFVKQ
jgi:pectin methylesterase-like acyl-CoA thioesterase